MEITTILNVYKRPQYLQEQIKAIQTQSVPTKELWIWRNENHGGDISAPEGAKLIESSFNFKYHGRFALALLAQTEWVAVFDDDTIPGIDWYKNCRSCIEQVGKSIMVSSGVKLLTRHNYKNQKYGCIGTRNHKMQQVHLGGHAWFFHIDAVRALWNRPQFTFDNGEDFQLSCFAQIDRGINTYVPPHPMGNKKLWGSTKLGYGSDRAASHKVNPHHYEQRNKLAADCFNLGWKSL